MRVPRVDKCARGACARSTAHTSIVLGRRGEECAWCAWPDRADALTKLLPWLVDVTAERRKGKGVRGRVGG